MKNNLLIMALIVFNYGAKAQIEARHYKIYDTKQQQEINLSDLVGQLKTVDVLFFGEEHNDSVAHYFEHQVLALMAQSYPSQVTLSLEMFDRDVQGIMNEYLSGAIREKNLIKDGRAWSNYRDYKPMVEYAKEHHMDVVCANAAGRYSNLAGRKGQKALMELPKASQQNFAPLPYDTASGKYYEKLMALTHDAPGVVDTSKKDTVKAQAPMMSMGNFNLIMAQSLWDATMAYSIAEYLRLHPNKKILQVNGRFHSDEGFAIVTQLKKYRPNTSYKIISCSSDEAFATIDWSKLKHLGDYVIITDPAIPKTFKE